MQHPVLFLRATSVADCMPLAYSKLLKLTAALNVGVPKKLVIVEEYLVDH